MEARNSSSVTCARIARVLCGVIGALTVAVPAQAQAPKDYSAGCTSSGCHKSLTAQKLVHDPASSDGCDACHEVKDEKKHTFEFAVEEESLCLECHEAFEGKVKHDPMAEGQCTSCHDPHSSNHDKLLRDAPAAKLCFECHDDFTEELANLHGPIAAGACTSCHNPHASDHGHLLRREGSALCLQCHDVIGKRLKTLAYTHDPAQEDCTACHQPHGGDNTFFLSSTPPALCLDCHDDIGDTIEEATVKHSAVTRPGGCAACHDPHASTREHLLAKKPVDLCLKCHDKKIKTPRGELRNFKALLAGNTAQHSPVADGDCNACHSAIHGGQRPRLLGLAYPASFYAPWSEDAYALCFDCHDVEAFEEAETDDATAFRNGQRSLHHLHVARTKKGRTCRACHMVHGATKPHLIAEKVPFGQWALPLGYQATDTGGSCQPGCHRRYRYDRETPVENLPPVAKSPPNPVPPKP